MPVYLLLNCAVGEGEGGRGEGGERAVTDSPNLPKQPKPTADGRLRGRTLGLIYGSLGRGKRGGE